MSSQGRIAQDLASILTGSDIPDSEFDAKALKRGTRHEMEHTNSRAIAKAIAKAHLKEHPDYYDKLEEAGL
jgi:hypothetical protein